jgi:hypothetical protein
MTRTILRIEPKSVGRLFGAMYFVLGLLLAPFFVISMIFSKQSGAGVLGIFAVGTPFVYGAMGYFGSSFFAWVYNILAARLGGLVVVVDDRVGTPEPPPA